MLSTKDSFQRKLFVEQYIKRVEGCGGDATVQCKFRDPRQEVVTGWLPGLVPQSVLNDTFQVRLPSLMRWAQKIIAVRIRRCKRAVANEWQEMIRTGSVRNRAELARQVGVSLARVTQVLGPIAT